MRPRLMGRLVYATQAERDQVYDWIFNRLPAKYEFADDEPLIKIDKASGRFVVKFKFACGETKAANIIDYLRNTAPTALADRYGIIHRHNCRHDEGKPCDGVDELVWASDDPEAVDG